MEYIEHNSEGTLFLKLIQEKFKYPLTVDDYHFHYFFSHKRDFAGIMECQLDENMTTIYVDKILLNETYADQTLSVFSKALSKTFQTVYVGDSQWIYDKHESKMFDVKKLPEVTIKPIFRLSK